jgi:AcrR family transcriptional regulator
VSELTGSGGTRQRRRRSDAERSVAAILDAAGIVLSRNPHASLEDVANAAGLTRQTVYAHFPSRAALISTLTDRATSRVTAALNDADLDNGPASEALLRLVQISWDVFDTEPLLLATSGPPSDPDHEQQQHQPVFSMLERLVSRGQRDGDLDPNLPTTWIIAATAALGHAAGEEVRTGRMTSTQASTLLRHALLRLFTTHNNEPDGQGRPRNSRTRRR